jgi:hypothetical protein
MITLRRLVMAAHRRAGSLAGPSSFERYYGPLARAGNGSPTADEARRDYTRRTRDVATLGWPR